MPESVFRDEYAVLLTLLRGARKRSGLTQLDLAERLGWTQSVVSKCERGERRLDVLELRDWCAAIDEPFVALISEFDREAGKPPRRRR